MNSTPLLKHLDIHINLSLFIYFLIKTFKILEKKSSLQLSILMNFKQSDHPNCYSLLNYSAYRRIMNFQINTISIFLLIQIY